MSLEQNEPRSVKTSTPRRRRRTVIWVVTLLALPFVVVLLAWYGTQSEQNGSKPPAPDAPEARQWKPEEPEVEDPSQPAAPAVEPSEGWNLPMEIVFDDIPEVPEEIKGPSPPIEEEGHH